MGRVLSARKGLETVKTQCIQAPDVQLLISDGLVDRGDHRQL
jgi:ethanolamine ammonia-lyase small subunit